MVVIVHPPLGSTGVLLLRELLAFDPELPVILACSSSEETLDALHAGALYVTRFPISTEEIAILTGRCRRAVSSEELAPPVSESRPGLGYQLPSGGIDFRELERDVLVQALQLAFGNQTRAASLLGLTRDQIRYRMAKFGMTNRDAA